MHLDNRIRTSRVFVSFYHVLQTANNICRSPYGNAPRDDRSASCESRILVRLDNSRLCGIAKKFILKSVQAAFQDNENKLG